MPIGDTFKKAAGLFFEFDDDPTGGLLQDTSSMDGPSPKAKPRTIEQIVEKAPGPNLDEIKPEATDEKVNQEVLGPDGAVQFGVIYALAKLPTAPFTAENVLEVLASLPAELPIEAQRTTVKVTLGAMAKTSGASMESVVADASRKLAALTSYAESFAKQAEDYAKLSEQEIARLEEQIATRRKAVEDAKSRAAAVVAACTAESDRLDDVLEFFSLDQAPSKHG